ncbi:MAG: DUF2892 domain-containing protein [Acidobacteria bacterium]|nr:DUF2892 domain-containing protein [Acidobacteriota bacterium]
MTIDNLIHVIGGTFVVLSVLLGMFVDPRFLWFTIFVGLNLAQSGVTGWCPMMSILRKLGVPERRTSAPV